jgi:hypothetical protein
MATDDMRQLGRSNSTSPPLRAPNGTFTLNVPV